MPTSALTKGASIPWRYLIGRTDSPTCRFCGEEEETGYHITFECPFWGRQRVKRWVEGTFRTWRTWEELNLRVWVDKGVDGGKDVDHVRRFFSEVDLR